MLIDSVFFKKNNFLEPYVTITREVEMKRPIDSVSFFPSYHLKQKGTGISLHHNIIQIHCQNY